MAQTGHGALTVPLGGTDSGSDSCTKEHVVGHVIQTASLSDKEVEKRAQTVS
jgi:hypothetical protein